MTELCNIKESAHPGDRRWPVHLPIWAAASRLVGSLHRCAGSVFCVTFVMFVLSAAAAAAENAAVLEIDGGIGPAVADYLVREIRAARPEPTAPTVPRMT